MITIKIHGEGLAEATIITSDRGGWWTYECSKGQWCNHQHEIIWDADLGDAIRSASAHVARHDQETLDKIDQLNSGVV